MNKWTKIGLFIIVCMGCIYNNDVLGLFFFDKTKKEYYDEPNGNRCLAVIRYTGNIWKNNSHSLDDDGRGIYVIPYKFCGHLPDTNYIRLNYIGAIENLYYKWQGDALYIRTMDYGMIDNKLPSTVVLDKEMMDYERWGRYHDTIRVMDQYLEWKRMKAEYSVIKSSGFN